MSVTLTWGSANAALADSINIYRATTPIDVNNLPVALATGVAGSATSYIDTTAVRNTTYYYVVGHVRGGNELLSQVLIMGHYPDTGPGPQTLLRGDWNLGYFGLIPTTNLFLPSQLHAQVPIPGALQADGNVTGYHKFIRKGKILFIPNNIFTTLLTFGTIYNNGLLFGTNDNGSFPFTPSAANFSSYSAPVNQYKVATQGAYQFIVRTLRASDKPTNVYATAADIIGGEMLDLFGRLGVTSLVTSPQDKWNDITAASNNSYCNTTHWSSLYNNWYSTNWDGYTTKSTQNGNEAGGYWLPVLELILT
jgi:hypothetical protein